MTLSYYFCIELLVYTDRLLECFKSLIFESCIKVFSEFNFLCQKECYYVYHFISIFSDDGLWLDDGYSEVYFRVTQVPSVWYWV